jgi:hypothetical protein
MRSFTFRTPPSIEAGAPRRILDAPSVFTFDNPVRSISPRRMTAEIAPRELQMSEDAKVADFLTQWTEDLQAMAGGSGHIGEAWSRSVLPFVACVTENRPGLASEMLADAREKMTQSPRLADVVDFDRKLLGAFSASIVMQRKLTAYNAVPSRPWMVAAEEYQSTRGADNTESSGENWRNLLEFWLMIANNELLANQRSDEFLLIKRELLLFSADLTLEMRKRNLMESVLRFDECGHVSPLMDANQIKIVMEFRAAK